MRSRIITIIQSLNVRNVIQSLRIFTIICLILAGFLNFCNVIRQFRMFTDICLPINLYGMYIAQQGCSSIAVEHTVAEILPDFCYRQETS